MPFRRQSSYDRSELELCAAGRLFTADSPRLPRDAMLMVDRVCHIAETGGRFERGVVEAELDIARSGPPEERARILWFFDCHFADDPVMPGCLGLDALWQMLGFFLSWSGGRGRGRALGLAGMRMSEQILPSSRLVTYRVHMRKVFTGRGATLMGLADGEVLVDGRPAYQAQGLRVGLIPSLPRPGTGDDSQEGNGDGL